MFKNFFLHSFIALFVVVALANLAQMEHMPWMVQISFYANQALAYLQQLTQPFLDFLRNLVNR